MAHRRVGVHVQCAPKPNPVTKNFMKRFRLRKKGEDPERWAQWMARAQDGDNRVYEQLLSELSGMLRDHVANRYPNIRDAEDAVQTILIALHKARHTYDPSRPFLPWLMAIARYRCLDIVRRDTRLREREVVDEELVSLQPAPDATDEATEAKQEQIQDLLSCLSEKERLVVTLLKLEEKNVKVVAERTGYSVSNVKVIASRAYKKIRERAKHRS